MEYTGSLPSPGNPFSLKGAGPWEDNAREVTMPMNASLGAPCGWPGSRRRSPATGVCSSTSSRSLKNAVFQRWPPPLSGNGYYRPPPPFAHDGNRLQPTTFGLVKMPKPEYHIGS